MNDRQSAKKVGKYETQIGVKNYAQLFFRE